MSEIPERIILSYLHESAGSSCGAPLPGFVDLPCNATFLGSGHDSRIGNHVPDQRPLIPGVCLARSGKPGPNRRPATRADAEWPLSRSHSSPWARLAQSHGCRPGARWSAILAEPFVLSATRRAALSTSDNTWGGRRHPVAVSRELSIHDSFAIHPGTDTRRKIGCLGRSGLLSFLMGCCSIAVRVRWGSRAAPRPGCIHNKDSHQGGFYVLLQSKSPHISCAANGNRTFCGCFDCVGGNLDHSQTRRSPLADRLGSGASS